MSYMKMASIGQNILRFNDKLFSVAEMVTDRHMSTLSPVDG